MASVTFQLFLSSTKQIQSNDYKNDDNSSDNFSFVWIKPFCNIAKLLTQKH